MRLLRRLAGALTLLLSTVGIVCCAAGITGTWVFYQRVSEKVQTVAAKLDVGLQRVSAGNQNVRGAVGKARLAMARVGDAAAKPGGGGAKGRHAVRTLIQHQAGPSIDELVGRLATLSDASVAVASLLESFQDLSAVGSLHIEPERLKRGTNEAQELSATLRRLEALVGDGDTEISGREIAAGTSEVDLILQRCLSALDDWQLNLDAGREDLARITGQTLGWLTAVSLAVTVLCLWVGLGQVSLFARALQWCKVKEGVKVF